MMENLDELILKNPYPGYQDDLKKIRNPLPQFAKEERERIIRYQEECKLKFDEIPIKATIKLIELGSLVPELAKGIESDEVSNIVRLAGEVKAQAEEAIIQAQSGNNYLVLMLNKRFEFLQLAQICE